MRWRAKPKELAEILNITERTLYRWRSERGMPPPVDGFFDLGDVLVWMNSRIVSMSPMNAKEAEQRLTMAKADMAELKYQIERGRFVDRAAALRSVERGIVGARGILMNLPRLVAAEVPQGRRGEVEDVVRRVVESCLKELEECKDIGGTAKDVIEDSEDGGPETD